MSKFKVWVDDDKVVAGNNILTSDVLNDDVQRINGFKSGTDVSSIRVNSMIRQNSLVSKALMDISGDNTLDATSSLNNVIAILKKSDNNVVNFTQADALGNITSGEKLSTSFGKISKQFDSLSTFMKEDEGGVKLYASSDTSKGTIDTRLLGKVGFVLLYDGGNQSHNLSNPISLSENIKSTDTLLLVANRQGYIVAGSSYQSSQSFSYTISSYGGISSVEVIVAWSDNSNSLSISGVSWNCEVNNTNNTAKMTATDVTTLRIGKIYKLVFLENSPSGPDVELPETGGSPI